MPALRYPKLFCTFLRVEQNPTNDNSYLECKIFIITQGVSIEPSPIRVLKRNAALIQPELLCHEILSSEGGGAEGAVGWVNRDKIKQREKGQCVPRGGRGISECPKFCVFFFFEPCIYVNF